MPEIKPTIMVVDDQPDFVEGVKLILEVEGYQVRTASNGREALDQLEIIAEERAKGLVSALPDLILADIMMPVMDGYVLYEHTQEHAALGGIPFVFLTAKTGAEDLQYGKDLGVEDYLRKPCSPDVLLASVRGQLMNKRPAPKKSQFFNDQIPITTKRSEMGMNETSQGAQKNANVVLIIVALIGILATLVTFLTLTPDWLTD